MLFSQPVTGVFDTGTEFSKNYTWQTECFAIYEGQFVRVDMMLSMQESNG
jgi:hypothetical protein